MRKKQLQLKLKLFQDMIFPTQRPPTHSYLINTCRMQGASFEHHNGTHSSGISTSGDCIRLIDQQSEPQ